MKRVITALAIIGSIFTANILFAQTTYYVSADGNDVASGTSANSAWKTLEKVNKAKFKAGDNILFNRGDVFKGQLKVASVSGVVYGAYGTGAKPVFTGKKRVSGKWVNTGNNIWRITLTNKKAEITSLFKNDSPLPISRYPDKNQNNGYLNFESHKGTTSITDRQLGSSMDFTGMDIIIRCEKWRLVKSKVTAQNGNTLTFKANAGIKQLYDNFGYFFINNKKLISHEGEWAYEKSGNLYLKSSANPNNLDIFFAGVDTLLSIKNATNVRVKDIELRYAGKLGLQMKNATGIVIDGVVIKGSGGDGITFNNTNNTAIQNSTITYTHWSGIRSDIKSNNNTFTGNTIRNIGNECYAKEKVFIGLDCNSSNSKIINNTVVSTGYAGIISAGKNNVVSKNIVDSACLILDDSGGIYVNGSISPTDGTLIENNIVTNSIGELCGSGSKNSLSNGIYLDHDSRNVTVRNNTVAFINGNGLFMNVILAGNTLTDNTSYKSGGSELTIVNPTSAQYNVKNNILVAETNDNEHNLINIRHTGKENIATKVGAFTTNFMAGALGDNPIAISSRDNKSNNVKTNFTLANWQSKFKSSGNNAAKRRASASEPAPKFYYNPTASAKSYKLDGPYTDVKNKQYCNTVSVAPFSSVVLFKGTGNCN